MTVVVDHCLLAKYKRGKTPQLCGEGESDVLYTCAITVVPHVDVTVHIEVYLSGIVGRFLEGKEPTLVLLRVGRQYREFKHLNVE